MIRVTVHEKVGDDEGKLILINPNLISSVVGYNTYTRVTMNDNCWNVKETIEEIEALIEKGD